MKEMLFNRLMPPLRFWTTLNDIGQHWTTVRVIGPFFTRDMMSLDPASARAGGKHRMAGAHGIEVADFQFENVAVEKEECAESLILGAGGDLIVRGQMGQELLDFAGPHGVGVFDAEKADVADDPLDRRPSTRRTDTRQRRPRRAETAPAS